MSEILLSDGANTNMNISKLREAAKILNTKNVPSDGRHIIIHANSLALVKASKIPPNNCWSSTCIFFRIAENF